MHIGRCIGCMASALDSRSSGPGLSLVLGQATLLSQCLFHPIVKMGTGELNARGSHEMD